jgi:hypothetical protein
LAEWLVSDNVAHPCDYALAGTAAWPRQRQPCCEHADFARSWKVAAISNPISVERKYMKPDGLFMESWQRSWNVA